MSTTKRSSTETITLGSGDLYCTEYTGTTPDVETLCVDDNLLGLIKGGASIEYTPTYYEATDDMGRVKKIIITEEEALLKSGIITWNGNTLKKLCSTARVTEASGKRTVKIGGAGNDDGKSYALCFHHSSEADGDVWVLIVGKNNSGMVITFAKDSETVIDAEFKALPQDDEGTLIQFIEEMPTE